MKRLSALLLLSLLSAALQAQVMLSNPGDLPQEQQIRTDWQGNVGVGPIPASPQVPAALGANGPPPRFGAHLFEGGFRGIRSDGLNADYRIMPGDQITLRVWGALELDRILPVDAQGNIFIPTIGPVQVQGLPHSQLDSRVRSAVRNMYPENVHVYTNLQGVQPVAVFVTGFVKNPGRYAGTPNDALLFFLDQAGGIDAQLGSYRNVRVLRDGRVIAQTDLYRFLLNGELQRPQFKDDDTIIVGPRGPSVTALGDVERPFSFELTKDTLTGQGLLHYARLRSDVSHVLLRGERRNGPFSAYYPVQEFKYLDLNDGDELHFSADRRPDTILVQIEGSHHGPSRFTLPKDARLHELLDGIPVPMELTDVESISIRRISVAERQRQSLNDSLRRLETTFLSAPSATPEEARIRVQEVEMIRHFVQRALQVEPSGRMVVANNGQIANVRLQDGDIITIPPKADSILISGEVLVPQSAVFIPQRSLQEYIQGAGGFTQHADPRRILIARQNGEVRDASDTPLRPGDEILILPKAPTKNLQLAATLSQMFYQLAIAARVVLDF